MYSAPVVFYSILAHVFSVILLCVCSLVWVLLFGFGAWLGSRVVFLQCLRMNSGLGCVSKAALADSVVLPALASCVGLLGLVGSGCASCVCSGCVFWLGLCFLVRR